MERQITVSYHFIAGCYHFGNWFDIPSSCSHNGNKRTGYANYFKEDVS